MPKLKKYPCDTCIEEECTYKFPLIVQTAVPGDKGGWTAKGLKCATLWVHQHMIENHEDSNGVKNRFLLQDIIDCLESKEAVENS